MAIFFAFISFLAWSFGEVFQTITVRKLGTYSAALWGLIVGFIYASVFIPFFLSDLSRMTFFTFFLIIILGSLIVSGLVFFNEALRISNPALVSTISSAFTGLVVLLSLIFFQEKLSFTQGISIVLTFVGLLLVIVNAQQLQTKKFTINRGIFFAILAMVCWAIAYTFLKIPIEKVGWFWPTYIYTCLFPFIFLYMKMRKIPVENPTKNKALPILISYSVLIGGAEYAYSLALQQGFVSIVAAITGSYPVLFVILSFVFFKEKVSKQQILGIIVTLIGIVLLSAFSV